MRTTIDIPDPLLRRAKATAARNGVSLKTFVTEAVEARLQREVSPPKPGKRVEFPLVRSRRPGSLRITGDMIDKALLDLDADALAGR